MRPRMILALCAGMGCVATFACSLLTHLDPPTGDGGGGDAATTCTPEVIVDFDASVLAQALYVDSVGGKLYFVVFQKQTVYSVPLDAAAGTTPTPVATNIQNLGRITGNSYLNQPYVFFASGGGTNPGDLFVVLPNDGGVKSVLDASVKLGTSTVPVHGFGLADHGIPGSIYWTNSNPNQILRTDLTQGYMASSTTLLTDADLPPKDIVVTAQGRVFWVTGSLETIDAASNSCGGELAYAPPSADNSIPERIYFTTEMPCTGTPPATTIQFVDPSNPQTPTTFESSTSGNLNDPIAMVYDGNQYVYWTNNSSSTIARKSVVDGGVSRIIAQSPGPPRQIVYYDGTLYWTMDTGLARCTPPP